MLAIEAVDGAVAVASPALPGRWGCGERDRRAAAHPVDAVAANLDDAADLILEVELAQHHAARDHFLERREDRLRGLREALKASVGETDEGPGLDCLHGPDIGCSRGKSEPGTCAVHAWA